MAAVVVAGSRSLDEADEAANTDAGDTLTLKSNSSCTCLATTQEAVRLSDSSPGEDHCVRLRDASSPLSSFAARDSGPSSLCSASPFESPTHGAACDLASDTGSRPDSLYLSRSAIQRREKQWLAKKGSYSSLSECDSSQSDSMDALIEAATSTPLHAQGTVAVDGDMITFVADGINELIKRSRNDSLSATGSHVTSQTPRSISTGSISSSLSGWSAAALSPGYSHGTRSPSVQSPQDIPPVDPKAILDLEIHAHHVADSVDSMMQSLTDKLFKMSTHTQSCLHVYKEAVDNTCDAVDATIKSMYALMAKCEELNQTIAPIYQLKQQIREIKRLLDLFEAQTAFD